VFNISLLLLVGCVNEMCKRDAKKELKGTKIGNNYDRAISFLPR
jgi:hypothetical protein